MKQWAHWAIEEDDWARIFEGSKRFAKSIDAYSEILASKFPSLYKWNPTIASLVLESPQNAVFYERIFKIHPVVAACKTYDKDNTLALLDRILDPSYELLSELLWNMPHAVMLAALEALMARKCYKVFYYVLINYTTEQTIFFLETLDFSTISEEEIWSRFILRVIHHNTMKKKNIILKRILELAGLTADACFKELTYSTMDDYHTTPLLHIVMGAQFGSVDMVSTLVEMGANLECEEQYYNSAGELEHNYNSYSAFYVACKNNNREFIQTFIARGLTPHCKIHHIIMSMISNDDRLYIPIVQAYSHLIDVDEKVRLLMTTYVCYKKDFMNLLDTFGTEEVINHPLKQSFTNIFMEESWIRDTFLILEAMRTADRNRDIIFEDECVKALLERGARVPPSTANCREDDAKYIERLSQHLGCDVYDIQCDTLKQVPAELTGKDEILAWLAENAVNVKGDSEPIVCVPWDEMEKKELVSAVVVKSEGGNWHAFLASSLKAILQNGMRFNPISRCPFSEAQIRVILRT